MEGQLTVSSQPGEGSVFEMTIPLLNGGRNGTVLSKTVNGNLEHTSEHPHLAEVKLRGLRATVVDSHHVRRVYKLSFLFFICTVKKIWSPFESSNVEPLESFLNLISMPVIKCRKSQQAICEDLVWLFRIQKMWFLHWRYWTGGKDISVLLWYYDLAY